MSASLPAGWEGMVKARTGLRVAFFTESLFPLVDGVSVTLGQLFATLEAQAWDFRVWSPFLPGPDVSWRGRVRLVRSFRVPLYRDYRVSLPWGHRAAAELAAWRPEIVHVVSPTPLARWAQGWAIRRGIPVVSSFHTHFVSYRRHYGFPSWLEGAGWAYLRRFYRRCDVVYVPSRGMMRELERHGIGRMELWARGVDPGRFSPAWRDAGLRARVGAGVDRPLLLTVGRLVREKDLADLVAVERILRARGHRFRLALVGEGPLRASLQTLLPDAFFAGHQSGEALGRWFASGDIFVFPSTTETFANVVLEAMASGLPAVVADRGGPPDLVAPGITGWIARPNDPEDFAARVETLLRDPGLRARMGAAARTAAQERDWPTVNGDLLESYARVAAQRRAGE